MIDTSQHKKFTEHDPARNPFPIGIFLAMRQPLARSAVKLIVGEHSEIEVVGESDQSPEPGPPSLESVDVLVADDRCIPRHNAGRCCLIVQRDQYESTVASAVLTGVRAIVDERSVEDDLVPAIRALTTGDAFLSAPLTAFVLNSLCTKLPQVADRQHHIRQLSNREREVLALFGNGYSNSDIAKKLHISLATVRSHVSHMMDKLELQNKEQLVLVAIQLICCS